MNRTKRLILVGLMYAASATTACSGMPLGEDGPDPSERVATAQQPLSHSWSKAFGASGHQTAYDVVVDGSDNVITVGSLGYSGSVDFDGAGGAAAVSTSTIAAYVAKFDDSGAHVWSKGFDDVGFENIAADSAGNIYLAGYSQAEYVDLGGGSIYAGDGMGIVVVKLDSSGNHVWSQVFSGYGASDYSNANGVAVDSSGDVVVTGAGSGYVEIGLDASYTDYVGAFVTKLDGSDGSPIFAKFFGWFNYAIAAPFSIAVDPGDDSFAITGRFAGYVDFGGGPLGSNSGWVGDLNYSRSDAFVAKFESDGDHLWSNRFGDDYYAIGTDVVIDGSGNVDVIGYFDGDIDFGSNTATLSTPAGDQSDMFLVQFSAAGTDGWSSQFGDTGLDNQERGMGVAVDSAGNVSIAGYFRNSIDFGGSTLTSAGGSDIAVAQFDDTGSHIWSQRYGGAYNDFGNGIAVDSYGRVAITGEFMDSVSFGGSTFTDTPTPLLGSGDAFLAQLAP
ncbi:SBBP repeat-containing protein [Sorangium sp. So ce117]|uniref:SBBP repeat-containing protein n=1 Tax=Sorangium sp. So ce117 TaxID=3133277 RepID=UPI003F6335B8